MLSPLFSLLASLVSWFRKATACTTPNHRGSTRLAVERLEGRDAPAVLFAATDGAGGRELWYSDGMAANTYRLKDINPNVASSDPAGFTAFNGKIYFAADDGMRGRELWSSNGTAAGTQIVADLEPGQISSSPTMLTVVGNSLVFATIHSETNFQRLHAIDNVGNITSYTINAGGAAGLSYCKVYNNRLYFVADNGTNGVEPWTWAPGETPMQIADIAGAPGAGSSPSDFVGMADKVFFVADNGSGAELWATDANIPGGATFLVKDISPGPPGSGPFGSTVFNGKLYFAAHDGVAGYELWVSDGTPLGTVLLKDIEPGAGGSAPMHFTEFNGWLYFTAGEATTGREVWKTDGTVAGTTRVTDLAPNAEDADPMGFTVFGNDLYFQAKGAGTGTELWRLNPVGPLPIMTDIAPGPTSSNPSGFYSSGGRLIFSAASHLDHRQLYVLDNFGNLISIEINLAGDANPTGFITVP